MIIDANNIFEPMAGTALGSTADSTNVLDFQNGRDLGIGDRLWVNAFIIGAAAAAAGAATLNIQVLGSLAAGSGFVLLAESGVIAKASLVLNSQFNIHVPPKPPLATSAATFYRYMKLTYTIATGPFTAGKIAAFLSGAPEASLNWNYPPGITVTN